MAKEKQNKKQGTGYLSSEIYRNATTTTTYAYKCPETPS